MKHLVENVHSHDFHAIGVPADLMRNSRQVTEVTQSILRDSQINLSATLSANSNPERIALTGILTTGILYGLVLPAERQVLYNIRIFEGFLDVEQFISNVIKHFSPQSVRYYPLSRSSSEIFVPHFSDPRL